MGSTSLETKFFTVIVEVKTSTSERSEYFPVTGLGNEEDVLKQVFKINSDPNQSVYKIFSTNYRGMNHLYSLVVSGGRVRVELEHRLDFRERTQADSQSETGGIY